MATKAEKKRGLDEKLNSELASELKKLGLEQLITLAAGKGGFLIGIFLSLVNARRSTMRTMALEEIRSKYGDQKIWLLGQQVAGDLTSEECWGFVHKVGGTIWVQNVYVTNEEGLSLVVFWHPDPDFKVEKGFTRIYRGSIQCGIGELTGPTLRAAPNK